MREDMRFEDREGQIIAWMPCDLSPTSIEEHATRLRSWALIRGASIAGPVQVVLRGECGARVCLPLAEWTSVHPETGISIGRVDPGTVARWSNVSLNEVVADRHSLIQALGGHHALQGDIEFHPTNRSLDRGDVVVPVRQTKMLSATSERVAQEVA